MIQCGGNQLKQLVTKFVYNSSIVSRSTVGSIKRWYSTSNSGGKNDNGDEISDSVFQFNPTLNYQYIKDNANYLQENAKNRKSTVNVHDIVSQYDRYRVVKKEIDSVRKERNDTTKKMKIKTLTPQERAELVEQGKNIKERLAQMEVEHDTLHDTLTQEALKIPNATHPDVPVGAEESSATLLGEYGIKPTFSFKIQDHLEIAMRLGAVQSANKTAGARFYYLTGPGAMLEMALSWWAFQRVHYQLGFQPVVTPDVIHPLLAEACGFQPRSEASQLYWIKDNDLCLTATAEIPMAGMHAGLTLQASQLPLKQVGFSHCFRSEVGGGTLNKGLYRVHQFSKVEMFVLSKPEDSDMIHNQLLQSQIEMFKELELPFRVLDMPTGDLGAPAYRKFDIEVWIPSRDGYGEISSASNCTDFQSRRLNIKYNDVVTGESQFVHTLNGTAMAIPRIILAILENNQQEDGSVIIPKVLRPFLNNQERLVPPPPTSNQ